MADQKITLNPGDTLEITVAACPVDTTAPTITEVDVKESDGSEVVADPVAPAAAA